MVSGYSEDLPSPDPPGWVDGAPTSAIGQSCAFCGSREVAWVHPLASDVVSYRVYGKGHTLPAFWALCDRCERIYATGDDDAAIEVMRESDGWSGVAEEDVEECVRQPLEVFRRADRGGRRFDPEPPSVADARRRGFVPLRELTGVADMLGPLWPPAHRLWVDDLGPGPGEYVDEGVQRLAPDRWLVRSPWPALSVDRALSVLWRRAERSPRPRGRAAFERRIAEAFDLTEAQALECAGSES